MYSISDVDRQVWEIKQKQEKNSYISNLQFSEKNWVLRCLHYSNEIIDYAIQKSIQFYSEIAKNPNQIG